MSCPSLERAASWRLGDLAAEAAERFEEHYFECDACLARVERLERLVDVLRRSLPPVLTPERRRRLEVACPGLTSVPVQPGEHATIRLDARAPIGLWLMRAPLARAARVDIEARDGQGSPLFAFDQVPFDAATGEVALLCQLHFRSLPGPDELHVRLTVTDGEGVRQAADYVLDHAFERL